MSSFYRYRFANIEYDESTGVLKAGGIPVSIEPRPRNLLLELLRHPNEVISKEEFLELLWDNRPTVDNVIATAVGRLRKALGEEGGRCVVNVARLGYRLEGRIDRVVSGQRIAAMAELKVGEPVFERDGYRLERRLGRGVGGEVWLARHSKLQAVRVFKFATDGERLTSLKREYTLYRVLSSQLAGPHDFARVLSANFSVAPYFLECEYGGTDLLWWATEGGHLDGMTTPDRVSLFLKVARAVAAAHGVGVLHKDLKPANVLIESSLDAGLRDPKPPEPGVRHWSIKLTDFGSSRLLEPGRLAELGVTAMGLTLTQAAEAGGSGGTPLYLAPELLAGGAPSMQSDLYALGLMLYQLLVGDFRRPMSIGWEREIDDELLREDLVAATEGRLEDRLASVAEWADRLATLDERRAVRDESAREAELARQATALLQRSRARRPWVGTAFAFLVLGLIGTLWFYGQARTALRSAQQESLRAQTINDFLNKDVLQSTDVLRVGTNKPVSMSDVLHRASDRAAERFKGQPRTEALVRKQLGETYLRLSFLADAQQQFELALGLLAPLVPANDPELLSLRFEAAQSRAGRFHPELALAQLDAAERAAGPAAINGADQLALLAARARVEVLMDAQKNKEALPTALRLVTLADQLANGDTSLRFEARQRLSELYVRLGDAAKAAALLAEITRAPYSETTVGEVLYARAKLQLARDRINSGHLAQAEPLLREVRDTMTRAFGPNELHVGLANSELADLYQTRGNAAAAVDAEQAAVVAFAGSLGDAHPYVIISKANLALAELDVGHAAEALAALDEIRPRIVALRSGASSLAGIDFGRARALNDLHRPAEAEPILDGLDAAALADSSWGPRDWQWKLQAEKARSLLSMGHPDAAQMLRKALVEMDKAGTPPWELAYYRKFLPAQRPVR